MRIALSSVLVADQQAALEFYTGRLGFVAKEDIPMGSFRWLTVVGANEPDGTELVLEPLGFEPARVFQKALYDAGIPATAFEVADVDAEHARLVEAGVAFRSAPADVGPTRIAVFDDTCGNLIQIFERPA